MSGGNEIIRYLRDLFYVRMIRICNEIRMGGESKTQVEGGEDLGGGVTNDEAGTNDCGMMAFNGMLSNGSITFLLQFHSIVINLIYSFFFRSLVIFAVRVC